MGLTPLDEIRNRLGSFNPGWFDSLNAQGALLLGVDRIDQVMGPNELPVPARTIVRDIETGVSRRMVNTAILALSRVVGADPAPTFPECDTLTSQVRQEFFTKRWREGSPGGGSLRPDSLMALMEGDAFGVGFLKIGTRRSPGSDRRKVVGEHMPAGSVWWDPKKASPSQSSWMAFASYEHPEVIRALYGDDAAERIIHLSCTESALKVQQVCRIVEYFDLGFTGGWAKNEVPTCAVFVGDWMAYEPVALGRNAYGFIPAAWVEGPVPPGLARPIGRIQLQAAITDGVNAVERRMKDDVGRRPLDVWNTSGIEESDLEAYNDGTQDYVRVVQADKNPRDVITRVPGAPVDQSAMAFLQHLNGEYNAASGTTELDRGTPLASARTATEVATLDARSQSGSSMLRQQAITFYRMIADRMVRVATMLDDDPVRLNIAGRSLWVNSPDYPAVTTAAIFEEPSEIVIGPQSLELTDTLKERVDALGRLEKLVPEVQAGIIDPAWYVKEKLKALGYGDNAEEALVKGPPPGQVALPGMPPAVATAPVPEIGE